MTAAASRATPSASARPLRLEASVSVLCVSSLGACATSAPAACSGSVSSVAIAATREATAAGAMSSEVGAEKTRSVAELRSSLLPSAAARALSLSDTTLALSASSPGSRATTPTTADLASPLSPAPRLTRRSVCASASMRASSTSDWCVSSPGCSHTSWLARSADTLSMLAKRFSRGPASPLGMSSTRGWRTASAAASRSSSWRAAANAFSASRSRPAGWVSSSGSLSATTRAAGSDMCSTDASSLGLQRCLGFFSPLAFSLPLLVSAVLLLSWLLPSAACPGPCCCW
mmetsp:Transcript_12271/g.29963  ORF Transcript_12271/g.29963 Transcript_12271/m.29963 type:complete len:288 (-) Transcript_12271:503-1366(-)